MCRFEITDIETREFENSDVLIIRKEEAIKYDIYFVNNKMLGVFFNKDGKVIGINTLTKNNIYSPHKIIKLIEDGYDSTVIEKNIPRFKDWWNKEILQEEEDYSDAFEDVTLTVHELEKYFLKSVETGTSMDGNECKWMTYYIHPSCGVSVEVGDSVVSYNSQQIKKIVIYMDSDHKLISCYDEHESWVEDVDISTTEKLNNINFIFERCDLRGCSTVNMEQQAYVELYENVQPYKSVEENRSFLRNWLKDNEKYL